jgi:hypothetical protein
VDVKSTATQIREQILTLVLVQVEILVGHTQPMMLRLLVRAGLNTVENVVECPSRSGSPLSSTPHVLRSDFGAMLLGGLGGWAGTGLDVAAVV